MMDSLTIKEQKLVNEYIENGGNGTQAALKVYGTDSEDSAAAIASRTLKKQSVAEALKMEMARQGITPESVIAPVAEALNAKKSDGSIDFSTRLAAHDRAVKILGLTEKNKDTPAVNFNINRANFGGEFVQDEDD